MVYQGVLIRWCIKGVLIRWCIKGVQIRGCIKGVLLEGFLCISLQELKEQFTAYRREKGENEAIVAQQMDTLRQEASGLRMDNVKITAKV